MALCPGLPGWTGTRRDIHPLTLEIDFSGRWSVIILNIKRMGKITEASALTIQLDATPSGRPMPPPPHPPSFTPDALPAATLPIYPGLGQAPYMLYYIPGELHAVLIKFLFNDTYKCLNIYQK